MIDVSALPDTEAEEKIYARMRFLDDTERLSYAERGLLARHVRDRSLWQHRTDPQSGEPCRSWTRWLQCVCPYSYSSVHAALADIEELKDIAEADLAQMTPSNIRVVKQLSTAVRARKDVIAAAKTQAPRDFLHMIQEKHPDQHLSAPALLRLIFTAEERAEVDEAIALALELGDGESPAKVVLGWAIGYKQDCMKHVEQEPLTERVQ